MEKSISLFILLFLSLNLRAQESRDTPIIVTAEKFERSYTKSTSTILKLDEHEIRSSGAVTVADLLKSRSGVSLFSNGAFGKPTSLFIRGTSNRHTLVIIDGMRMTDLTAIGGGSRLEFLNTSDIQSIEILKGSQGVLYGGEAIGGVLKITTKKKKNEGPSFKLGAGSFGQFNVGGNSKLNKTGSLGLLQVSHSQADGISAYNNERAVGAENDGYETTNVRYKNTLEVKEGLLNINAFFQQAESDFDNSSGDVTGNETTYQTYGLFGLYQFPVSNFLNPRITAEFRRIKTDTQTVSGSTPSFFYYEGTSTRSELSLPMIFDDKIEVLFGVSWEMESSDALDTRFDSSRSRQRTSFFTQARKEWDRLFMEIGGRFETIEEVDDKGLYRIAFGLNLGHWTFKAHQATGFRAPSLYQNFSGFGNTNLKVESSISRELSALYQSRALPLRFEVSAFEVNYSNFVDFDSSTNRYENFGAQDNYGLETSLGFSLFETQVLAQANLLRAYDPISGAYAIRRPRQSHSLRLQRKVHTDWTGALSGQYVGERNDRNNTRMPSYLTFDLHMTYNREEAGERVNFDFKNILNREYEEIRNFGTPGFNVLVSWERQF